jgi:hypothetical protein
MPRVTKRCLICGRVFQLPLEPGDRHAEQAALDWRPCIRCRGIDERGFRASAARIVRCLFVALALVLTACCPRDWRIAADIGTGVADASLACDGGSTVQYLHDSQWVETNPLLGEHPGELRLWSYLGAIAIGLLASNHYLPPKYQLGLAAAVFAIELESIAVNMSVGSSVCGIGHGGPWKPVPAR